jgi:deoxyribonuclease-4
MKFGAHMSASGGAWRALQRGRSIDCEIVQIFVKNNMQWFGAAPTPQALALYANERALNTISCVFGHAGYLINLGGSSSANRDRSLQSLVHELEFAAALGLPFLVLHPGAHLGTGERHGLTQIVSGLNQVLNATKKLPVRIALENTAGQGTCLGNKLSHLATIFDEVDAPKRLGICLDTAHLFAAGYDIRTPKGWNKAINEVSSLIGLKQVLAFHLNDSKTRLGSRVDRHEHIGKGEIGKEAFRFIVNDPRFQDHPGCLETPKSETLREDIMNLTTLRSLRKRHSTFRKRESLQATPLPR